MAAVDVTADVPMSPQDMWDRVSDLSELGDWLVMHEGWRSELPDELGEGTRVVGVARAKGFLNRVTWTVTAWQPPHRVALSGSGKGGARYTVTLSVSPTKQGSNLGVRLELGGRALFGPRAAAAPTGPNNARPPSSRHRWIGSSSCMASGAAEPLCPKTLQVRQLAVAYPDVAGGGAYCGRR